MKNTNPPSISKTSTYNNNNNNNNNNDDDDDDDDVVAPQSSLISFFKTNRFITVVTIIRILIAISVPVVTLVVKDRNLSEINHNSGWSSVWVNPILTLRHLREGMFFIKYYNKMTNNSSMLFYRYQGLLHGYKGMIFFHLPPIVVLFFEPYFHAAELVFQNITNVITWNNIGLQCCVEEALFGLLMLIVDFYLAYVLMVLSKTVINYRKGSHSDTDMNDILPTEYEIRERILEFQMEGRIRSRYGFLFGMPSLSDEPHCNQYIPKEALSSRDDDNTTNKVSNKNLIMKDHVNNIKNNDTDDNNHATKELNNTQMQPDVNDDINSNNLYPKSTVANNNANPPSIIKLSSIPQYIFLLSYCNPISILSSTFFHSFQSMPHLMFICAIYQAYHKGNAPISTLCLAIWFHVEFMYPLLYLVPIIGLVSRIHGIQKSVAGCLGFFCLWNVFLFAISYLLLNDANGKASDWIRYLHPYVNQLRHEHLSPNLGITWYFHVQMFHRFRDFFVIILNGLPFLSLLPLSMRFWPFPLELTISTFFVRTLYSASLNLQNTMFLLIMPLLSPQSLARMELKLTVIFTLALVVPVSLFILDYWLWLDTGSGNANYLFFQSLVYTIFLGVVTLNFVFANVTRVKALRLTIEQIKNKE